jgi:hypothetical protein
VISQVIGQLPSGLPNRLQVWYGGQVNLWKAVTISPREILHLSSWAPPLLVQYFSLQQVDAIGG